MWINKDAFFETYGDWILDRAIGMQNYRLLLK